jgi:hypothetical protein
MTTLKRALMAATVFATLATHAQSTLTNEVLVLTTPTLLPRLSNRKAIEVQNLGVNSIFCALTDSSKAIVNKARRLQPGETWVLDIGPTLPIYCVAATASQTTGAATIVTEIR